jgi:rhodanese-related sulfurtransferase
MEIFATKQDILPKEKKIIVYCNTGSRSYLSYRKLMKMDYKQIYQALFAEWKEAGLEVAR